MVSFRRNYKKKTLNFSSDLSSISLNGMTERFKYFPDQLLARMLLLKGDMENGDGYDNKKGNICWEGIFNLEKDVACNDIY